jgi:hypothetical protein
MLAVEDLWSRIINNLTIYSRTLNTRTNHGTRFWYQPEKTQQYASKPGKITSYCRRKSSVLKHFSGQKIVENTASSQI